MIVATLGKAQGSQNIYPGLALTDQPGPKGLKQIYQFLLFIDYRFLFSSLWPKKLLTSP